MEIKVKKNIGALSKLYFGKEGTIHEVKDGTIKYKHRQFKVKDLPKFKGNYKTDFEDIKK